MIFIRYLKRGYKDLLQVIYPRLCVSCQSVLHDSENLVCHKCLSSLSLTNFDVHSTNPVYNKLSAIVNIEKATALFLFDKSGVMQQLIHQLKYHNRQEIGKFIFELSKSYLETRHFFNDVDMIVPVPLHPKKLKHRGYNQLSVFGRELADYFNVDYKENILIRAIHTESQTKKNITERRLNVSGAFKVKNPEKYQNKHFLVIDDVLTTGATIEACVEQILQEISGSKVSVLVMSMVL